MLFAREAHTIAPEDEAIEGLHPGAAVFAIHVEQGEPYIGRTTVLRRRLKRLLRRREQPSRLLNLRSLAQRVDYWPVHSRLEGWLVLRDVARHCLPSTYLDLLKLRMPPFVKVVLGNSFPRTQVTSRLTGGAGQFFGPFRTRAAAEEFEHGLLDLFQIRRCQEDLAPMPEHPGCIYGEMGMCLRPCQQIVSPDEYRSEVERVSDFLRSSGAHAIHTAEAMRERMSAELEFEEAARQHKRVERIHELLKLRDELARDVDQLNGIAITSADTGAVLLWRVHRGCFCEPVRFDVANTDQSVSMDRRLRDIFAAEPAVQLNDRPEHLAILARWVYSSWCDGAWINVDSPAKPPYRRMVSAISRTVHQTSPAASH